jgi:2-iminobutanoate/2-iminopropanoate deaminase
MDNKRVIISSDNAPKAVGPYSQAVRTGNLIYCSGQIPIDPRTGEFPGTDVESQARQCMENLSAVLNEAGSSLDQSVKMQIYLIDMGDFAAVNEIYGSFFSVEPPARACIAVSALPKGARVEIEAIAVVED